MLRQFPLALKLYDRALDITPNDPDLMADKGHHLSGAGQLGQAAKSLSEITWTHSSGAFVIKLTQLRLERNYGEAIGLLQARLAQSHFDSPDDKADWQVLLAFIQRLAGEPPAQRLRLNRRAVHSISFTEINQTAPTMWDCCLKLMPCWVRKTWL